MLNGNMAVAQVPCYWCAPPPYTSTQHIPHWLPLLLPLPWWMTIGGSRCICISSHGYVFYSLFALFTGFVWCYWIITTHNHPLSLANAWGFFFLVASGTVAVTLKLTCHHHHPSLQCITTTMPPHKRWLILMMVLLFLLFVSFFSLYIHYFAAIVSSVFTSFTSSSSYQIVSDSISVYLIFSLSLSLFYDWWLGSWSCKLEN